MNQTYNSIATPRIVQMFLESTDANPRNTMYIKCSKCTYKKLTGCVDFLFTVGNNGRPLLLPITDAQVLMSREIAPSNCLGVMDSSTFLALYRPYFLCTAHLVPESAPYYSYATSI